MENNQYVLRIQCCINHDVHSSSWLNHWICRKQWLSGLNYGRCVWFWKYFYNKENWTRYVFFLEYVVSLAIIWVPVCLMEDSCKVCRFILVGLVPMLSLPCWWQCYGWVLKCAYLLCLHHKASLFYIWSTCISTKMDRLNFFFF